VLVNNYQHTLRNNPEKWSLWSLYLFTTQDFFFPNNVQLWIKFNITMNITNFFSPHCDLKFYTNKKTHTHTHMQKLHNFSTKNPKRKPWSCHTVTNDHTIQGRNDDAISITSKLREIFKGTTVLYNDQCFSLFSMSTKHHILSNLSQHSYFICAYYSQYKNKSADPYQQVRSEQKKVHTS
jgi:hypothetical protein